MTPLLKIIKCPECAWRPDQLDRWDCRKSICNHSWQVFDTAGICPSCATPIEELLCSSCKQSSPLSDWYVGLTDEKQIIVLHDPSFEALQLNFPLIEYFSWQEKVVDQLLAHPPIPLKIIFQFAYRSSPPEIQLYTTADAQAQLPIIEASVQPLLTQAPTPLVASHAVLMELNLAGNDVLTNYSSPFEQKKEAFTRLSIGEQVQSLQSWAYREALPMLGKYASQLDFRNKGIRGMGRRLPGIDPKYPRETIRQTSEHPYYWKAFLEELNPDSPLLMMMKVLLHTGHGQFELAKKYNQLYAVFSNQRSVAHFYYQEFLWRFQLVQEALEKHLAEILQALDNQRWEQAIELCDLLLVAYPASPDAQYYRFVAIQGQGKLQKGLTQMRRQKALDKIFANDPLYEKWEFVEDKYEAYHMALRREAKIILLALQVLPGTEEIIQALHQLGIITTELKDHEFAAHVFALLFTYHGISQATESLTDANFLFYNLKKLRMRELTTRYKGNLRHEAVQIERHREHMKQNHPAYLDFSTASM